MWHTRGDQPDKQTGGSASQLLPGKTWRLSLPSRLAPVTLVFRLRGSKQEEELHNARGALFAVPVGMVPGQASMLGKWALHRLHACASGQLQHVGGTLGHHTLADSVAHGSGRASLGQLGSTAFPSMRKPKCWSLRPFPALRQTLNSQVMEFAARGAHELPNVLHDFV